MKKTSNKIISLILSLTLICTMLVGFGTIETFAAGEQLVTKTVHFNYNDYNDQNLTRSGTNMKTGASTKTINLALNNFNSNSDLHFKSDGGPNNQDGKVIKFQYLSTYGGKKVDNYIESYASQATYKDNVLTGSDIFEFTGDIYLGQKVNSSTSNTNWCCYHTNGATRSSVMFNNAFVELAPKTWYSFRFKIDLGNDKASLRFTNLDNPSSGGAYKDYGYTHENFYSIKINPLGAEGDYLYFDNIKTTRYSTSPGKKAVITSVGENNAAAPGNKLSFTLDKTIELDKNHITVTGGEIDGAVTATALESADNINYTATLSSQLEPLTENYTLNISGTSYDAAILEVQGDSYVAVTPITKTFATTDTVFTEDSKQGDIDDAMAWGKITDADIDALTLETKLPDRYRGADLTWTSDPAGYISENGQIIKNEKLENAEVELTAAVSVNDTKIGSISYNVTILKEELKKIIVHRSYVQGVRSAVPEKASVYSVTGKDENIYYANSFQFDLCAVGVNGEASSGDAANGDALAFMQFNLSDHKKIVDAATSVKLVIPAMANTGEANYNQGTTIVATLLNDSSDEWDNTLTYNKAVNSGMYGDRGLYTKTGVKAEVREDVILPEKTAIVIEDANLTSALKDALMQDPDDGKVSFRFYESNGWACKFQSGNWSLASEDLTKNYAARLEISYYESDLKEDSEFANTLTWGAITTQDRNNVVADLNLPASWFGQAVTWETSDANVITNAGEVIIPEDEAKDVTLTAKINNVPTSFDITVPATKIAVKSDKVYDRDIAIQFDGMNPVTGKNCSTGYIYANEDIEGPYKAMIATYNADGELIELTLRDSAEFRIKEGRNVLPAGNYYSEFEDVKTKVIIVDNMTDLKPLAAAK